MITKKMLKKELDTDSVKFRKTIAKVSSFVHLASNELVEVLDSIDDNMYSLEVLPIDDIEKRRLILQRICNSAISKLLSR